MNGVSLILWRRPTLPDFTLVPSAWRGLTSLFEMGRGGHPHYNHHKVFSSQLGIIEFVTLNYNMVNMLKKESSNKIILLKSKKKANG